MMGMYTELVLKAEIRPNICELDYKVLDWLFNRHHAPKLEVVPDHPFFECSEWQGIGYSESYYHVPWASSRYWDGYIFCRCDLQNYAGEIELFLDWFFPLVRGKAGDCIGWSWYEEEDEPTLVKLPDKMPPHTKTAKKATKESMYE